MLYTRCGQLPRHIDCFVDDAAVLKEPAGRTLPCRWFGLTAHPGRMWGCTVLLESGAVYRGVPPHMMAFEAGCSTAWCQEDSQLWECYGWDFTTLEYSALAGLRCAVSLGDRTRGGRYLFTAAHVGDGYTADPTQDKEFYFIALANGRLTIQPTDRVQFDDRSWTTHGGEWPTGLKRSDTVWRCE